MWVTVRARAQVCVLNEAPPSLEEAITFTANPAVVKLLIHRTVETVPVRVARSYNNGWHVSTL